MADRRARGLAVVAAMALLLVLTHLSRAGEAAQDTADLALSHAEDAAGRASEATGRVDDLEGRVDDLASRLDYRFD